MSFLLSLRPRHWLKNLLVFAPLVFAGRLFVASDFLNTIAVFLLFSALASGVYLINDIQDRGEDALHPRKRLRPISSGSLSVRRASIGAAVLIAVSLLGSFYLSHALGALFFGYLALQLVYGQGLKRIAGLDVVLVGIGFVLRVYAGALSINVPVSHWLITAVFLLALLLVFSKRHQELLIMGNEAGEHRKTLSIYTPEILRSLVLLSSGITAMAYILYTTDPETIVRVGPALLYTSTFIFIGIFRFLILLYKGELPDNPMEIIFKDKVLFFVVLLWGISVLSIFYR